MRKYVDFVDVSSEYKIFGPYPVVNLGWTHRLTYPGKQDIPYDVPLICLNIDGHYLWIESAFIEKVEWKGGFNPPENFSIGIHCNCPRSKLEESTAKCSIISPFTKVL